MTVLNVFIEIRRIQRKNKARKQRKCRKTFNEVIISKILAIFYGI